MNLKNIFKDVVVGILPDGFRKNLKDKMLRWGERGVHDFLHTEQDSADEYAKLRTDFLDAAAIEATKQARWNGCSIREAIEETPFIQSTMRKGLRQGDEISVKEVEEYAKDNKKELEWRLSGFR